MDIQAIFEHLDILFSKQQIDEVEPFLTKQLHLAYERKDYSVCISIINELMGFLRDTSQYDKALGYCEEVLKLMQQLGYEGTLPYATTCLNVANVLRAAGLHKESLQFYERIIPIYRDMLSSEDERFAALYNNMSLLYQEMGDYEAAVQCLTRALAIVSQENDEIKVAITHSNLGASLLQLGRIEEAMEHLKAAMSVFDQSEEKDFHYSAAIAAMGQAYVALRQLDNARECYLEALYEQMKHCGKSEAFYRILENLHAVEVQLGLSLTEEPLDIFRNDKNSADVKNAGNEVPASAAESVQKPHIHGLDLSMDFYEHIAKEELFRAFPDLVERMAIGLAGEGSECYGFDDALSADHDFGPGFCIWLSKEDYDAYGDMVQTFYDKLPERFRGYSRYVVNGEGRVGVWCIDDFFRHYVGYISAEEMVKYYASAPNRLFLTVPEEGMSVILNGRIFHDPSGLFTASRKAFYEAFTEENWRFKIANALIELGKYGQYNYPRCMKRGDYVTAQMVLYKYIESLLKLVHYVNHVFPPYYKWLKKSASRLDKLAVLADLTEALADFADGRAAWAEEPSGATDKITGTIEIIAGLIIDECRKDGLFEGLDISTEELFLEIYGRRLLAQTLNNQEFSNHISDSGKATDMEANKSFTELVDYLVSLEWQAFDEVQNQGGRAECQDDWNTFSIMRKSQYMTWPKELLISFIEDFREANRKGWNLITEKYGRMMETTDPHVYAEIQDKLPTLTAVQTNIIKEIVQIQVTWMEEFAERFPHMAANSRVIHTAEDSLFQTSYETYLRGELSTYSPKTLKRYGVFIVQLVRDGRNLAELTMEHTAKLYGYASLEDAEQCLANYK